MEANCYDCMKKNCLRQGIDKNKFYSFGSYKYNVFDWLAEIENPKSTKKNDIVEVRFKNGRKDFFLNANNLDLLGGNIVAVEALPGHDIGLISLTGELVDIQMKRKGYVPNRDQMKKVYRMARPADIEKWESAKAKEQPVKQKAREIAIHLKLDMKITDVEFQGDGTKAIFYYSADDRVDFRELIKKYAEAFRIRVEMKQIGVRQEASRLGGIGSCGRELCCSTWLNDFQSVSTNTARTQQLSLNPHKLAGQCAKLKCCLNFEQDSYYEALTYFPNTNTTLKSKLGTARFQKLDVHKKLLWYSYEDKPYELIMLTLDRVMEVILMNKKGIFPPQIEEDSTLNGKNKPKYKQQSQEEDITRFDKKK